MPRNSNDAQKLRFDWDYFRQSKKFIHVNDERKAFVKKKLELYARMGYAAFQLGSAKRKKWNERYDNKPPHLSQDIWGGDLWRFRVDNKIRVFAIFDESPQDEVIGYVLWVDLTHRTGDK